ncbi:MAG TPA: thioredoxin-dependent thiol peroxidase [Candidatus Limnocylindria bacterium]|nr:thioredoxin-dependent thiol peroxidase [Candidatus Limnocylindria bacterium]
MAQLTEGDQAPVFALPDQDGKTVSSESLRGAPLVVYFYPKDDTPGCTTEACQFNDNMHEFQRAGVPVVGISPDAPESHLRFREKYSLGFTLLSDEDHRTIAQFGAWGDRADRGEGVIRSTVLLGGDGKVRKAWYGVKPDGHAQEVLAALRA